MVCLDDEVHVSWDLDRVLITLWKWSSPNSCNDLRLDIAQVCDDFQDSIMLKSGSYLIQQVIH
jgi:hypothetical protein